MLLASFRTRLALAMTLVVAGVTTTTYLLTRKSVQAMYLNLYEQQFQSRVEFNRKLQDIRLAAIKFRCLEAAQSVRLKALLRRANSDLESGDHEDYQAATEKLYQTASDEMRELLHPANAESTHSTVLFFRFLDSQNKVLTPGAASEAGLVMPAIQERLHPQLAEIGKASTNHLVQPVGFLAPMVNGPRKQLVEVIYTPAIDVSTATSIGGLIVGFTVVLEGDFSNPNSARSQAMQNGLWLEGDLYMNAFDETLKGAAKSELARQIPPRARGKGDFMCWLGGHPFRVFYEQINAESAFPPASQVCFYSWKEVLEEQKRMRWKILGSGAVAMLGALLLSGLLSHGLSIPIRELSAGTTAIQRGNLEVRVPVRTRDELGALAQSFNSMAEGLALKEKYRSILDMVADKQVAGELIAGNVALGGETRRVSVLFCDIRGFTALTQDMDPAEVIELLNEHMTVLTRVVYDHQGVVDKFVGDLIMAIFGAPKSYGDDADNAVRCALKMIAERKHLNDRSRYQIRVGIGVATGNVVAGCMGSQDRHNYTVLGERVNLASRLCGQAGPMEIVIDQTTREALGDRLEVLDLPELKLKGFSYPVQAYKLLSAQPVAVA